MRVHQILVGASPGDAVTQIACAIDDLIAPFAESAMWALHLDPRCEPRIGSIKEFPTPDRTCVDDVIIYHLSIGEARVTEMVMRRPERLVVHYHNVTPARYFRDVDADFARLLSSGRDEARALVGRADLVLAPSEYNADELRPYCAAPVQVTPPPVDHTALTQIEAHAPTLNHFAEVVDVPVVLHVGQMLPHKRPDVLVAAFHILTVDLRVPAQLILLGPHRNTDYAWAVQHYANDLGLSNVALVGERSAEELAAFFRSSSAFVTASEHEGFCLPVVEAFAFGLPVIARAVAALPETAGAGGLLLPAEAGPALFAEALARVLTDEPLRAELVEGGRERLDRYSLERSRTTMVESLLPLLRS